MKGYLLLLATLLFLTASVAAAPIPVLFKEGMVHGSLLLESTAGMVLANGDLLQSTRNGEVNSRMVFRFKDGSLFEERVAFTQKRAFTMQSYGLVKKGPAFSEDTEVSLDRDSGKYRVKTRKHKDGEEKVLEGSLDLPLDVYNGMIPVITKNLHRGAAETVHMVTFTPAPKVVELELIPSGQHKVLVGKIEKNAVHYVLKPKLGAGLKFLAKLTGRMPPDNHAWILASDLPAFVRFEGQLYFNGPIWRIELTSPHLPD